MDSSPIPDDPKPAPAAAGPLNAYEPDKCCGRRISKALRSDLLNAVDEWTCPECGEKWTPEMRGAIRYWMPRPYFITIRARG
jgi:hypothetical protein